MIADVGFESLDASVSAAERRDAPVGEEAEPALNGIGWLHLQLGYHRQALACCERVLPLLRSVGFATIGMRCVKRTAVAAST